MMLREYMALLANATMMQNMEQLENKMQPSHVIQTDNIIQAGSVIQADKKQRDSRRDLSQQGFSLFEALIGVVIMGIVGTVALRSTHGAQQSVAAVHELEEAQRVMSGVMREMVETPELPIRKGTVKTTDSDITWKLTVTPIQLANIASVELLKLEYTTDSGRQQELIMWRPVATVDDGAQ